MIISRFAVIGILSTALSYLLMIVLLRFTSKPLATMASYCLSFLVGYKLHMIYTIREELRFFRIKKRLPLMTLLLNLVVQFVIPWVWPRTVWICPLLPSVTNFISVRYLATKRQYQREKWCTMANRQEKWLESIKREVWIAFIMSESQNWWRYLSINLCPSRLVKTRKIWIEAWIVWAVTARKVDVLLLFKQPLPT